MPTAGTPTPSTELGLHPEDAEQGDTGEVVGSPQVLPKSSTDTFTPHAVNDAVALGSLRGKGIQPLTLNSASPSAFQLPSLELLRGCGQSE